MCQEHCHFDVQVVRWRGGAGLPSAVRLALAGSAHTLARLWRPAGLSGCGFTWLCWKVPGLPTKPGHQADGRLQLCPRACSEVLSKLRPESNFDNYTRTGLELGLMGLCSWPARRLFMIASDDSNSIATYLASLPCLSLPKSALRMATQIPTVLKTCQARCCLRAFALAASSSKNTSSRIFT